MKYNFLLIWFTLYFYYRRLSNKKSMMSNTLNSCLELKRFAVDNILQYTPISIYQYSICNFQNCTKKKMQFVTFDVHSILTSWLVPIQWYISFQIEQFDVMFRSFYLEKNVAFFMRQNKRRTIRFFLWYARIRKLFPKAPFCPFCI